ncbi:uncharacterized protein [Montipora capricornis]|uniref:uncharacterized protein n=1 Tax=Montipora capricornis TaxID=246305 RepID=UPI0035F0FFA0
MANSELQDVELENTSAGLSTERPRPSWWRRARATVFKNFLPISLVFFVVLGILVPEPGVFFSELPTQYVCVVGLFFHSGLKLKTGEVKDALKSFKALFWGIISILLITPLIGGHLTGLLPYQSSEVDNLAKENGPLMNGSNSLNVTPVFAQDHSSGSSFLGPILFRVGMQIYFIVPCTISAGVILTGQADGAVALSVMLTVICNLAAVFTVPPLVAWIVDFKNVKLDPINLLIKLVLTVLLPLLVGKAIRCVSRVKRLVIKFSDTLKVISIILLTIIPWLKVSQASAQNAFSGISVASIFAVLGWGLAMHVLFVIVIFPPCLLLKLARPALKSVVIMASQKSLAVAVTISGFLPFTQAEQGLISLPLIIIHLGILVTDSVLVSWWSAWDAKKDKAKAKSELQNGDAIVLSDVNDEQMELVQMPKDENAHESHP